MPLFLLLLDNNAVSSERVFGFNAWATKMTAGRGRCSDLVSGRESHDDECDYDEFTMDEHVVDECGY
jgi:hypothetical protein